MSNLFTLFTITVAVGLYALFIAATAPPTVPVWEGMLCGRKGCSNPGPIIHRHVVSDSVPGAARVAAAFHELLDAEAEAAAHVAVYVRGECVVDVRGVSGATARATGDTEPDDDLFVVFSSTKILEGIAVAMLVDRGSVSYETRLVDIWPEFKGAGQATVAHLMRHELGLPALDRPLDLVELGHDGSDDHLRVLSEFLASQVPELTPGDSTFYHAITRGLYVDEIVRRVDPKGRDVAHFIEEEVVHVLGLDGEVAIGERTMDHDEMARIVRHFGLRELAMLRMYTPQIVLPDAVSDALLSEDERVFDYEAAFVKQMVLEPTALGSRAIAIEYNGTRLASAADMANSKPFIKRGLSSAAGVTAARSLARIGSVLASGGAPLLSADGLAAANAVRSDAPAYDAGFFKNVTYAAAGWGMDRFDEEGLVGWEGWAGAGGSMFVWNRELETAFSYTPSLLLPRLRKVRAVGLLKAFLADDTA